MGLFSFRRAEPKPPAVAEAARASETLGEAVRRSGKLAVEFSGPLKDAPGVHVSILRGDMTLVPLAKNEPGKHGLVVPHFISEASPGGVGAAILGRLGDRALEPYDAAARKKPFAYGDAHYTSAEEVGTKDAYPLIGVATAGIPKAQGSPGVVFRGAANAIQLAAEKGLTSLTFPALDTGIIGHSSGQQSAAAILGAAKLVAANGTKIPEILITVYDRPVPAKNHGAAAPFVQMAEEGAVYLSEQHALADTGNREFDLGKWMLGMRVHIDGAKRMHDGRSSFDETKKG
jgi:O-acetyl-ADP-ribose deacetylase (regulator of RNase III)